eukprot:403369065
MYANESEFSDEFFSYFDFDICCVCQLQISEVKAEYVVINAEKCLKTEKHHFSHQKCFVSEMNKKIASDQDAICMDCGLSINDKETFKIELDKVKIDEIKLKFTKCVLNIGQLSKKIGKYILDSKKEELLIDHQIYVCEKCNYPNHMKENESVNLIECGSCFYSACKDCKIEPYHYGYSCIEYKESLENVKCRFCMIAVDLEMKKHVFPVCIHFVQRGIKNQLLEYSLQICVFHVYHFIVEDAEIVKQNQMKLINLKMKIYSVQFVKMNCMEITSLNVISMTQSVQSTNVNIAVQQPVGIVSVPQDFVVLVTIQQLITFQRFVIQKLANGRAITLQMAYHIVLDYKQYQRYQAQLKWRNSWNIIKAFQEDEKNEEM